MNNQPQIIKQLPSHSRLWQPIQGAEATALLANLNHLDTSAKNHLLAQSISVLSKCLQPDSVQASDTGLVIGYVQSGKTMSFTTVTALARDNNFQLIIVFTGISTTLDNQSAERIRKELRLDTRTDHAWIHYDNPKERLAAEIQDELDNWADPDILHRKTILLTVMKNVTHLKNLGKMLRRLRLSNVTALVIDDEADQAGLNLGVNNNQESTTYARILEIRQALSRHTYLQYTATPQAPLLISLIDKLSPRFVELLEPGQNYTGGKTFFEERKDLIERIPPSELPSSNSAPASCPESLLKALRIFVLGIASNFAQGEHNGNRSMMVHPASRTSVHHQYYIWVKQIIFEWKDRLALDPSDPDRQSLVSEFQHAYKELQKTVPNLTPFADLCKYLLPALRDTNTHEVNTNNGTKKTESVDWSRKFGHVLVGGAALDRGFTVEGLTVTYMPRSLARTPNADTVQQRARFFGYKRKFLDYCRVFLEQGHQDGFTAYVRHEEDIRSRLIEHNKTGKPLTQWKRAFFLDLAFQATRKDVLSLDYTKAMYSREYFYPVSPQTANVADNQHLISNFRNSVSWTYDNNQNWTPAQRHNYALNLSLEQVMADLLVGYNLAYHPDSRKYTGVLLQLERLIEESKKTGVKPICHVVDLDGYVRSRSARGGALSSLWEGAAPGTGYPGDQKLLEKYPDVRIQIHHLDIKEGGVIIAANVPLIAIYMPEDKGAGWQVHGA